MLYLVTNLTLLGQRVRTRLTDQYQKVAARDSERGAITIEQVIWAGVAIALATLVIGAITSYVNAQVTKIG
jgi:hypothetical protein